MSRHALVLVIALFLFGPASLFAWQNDGPPIAITSPDTGTTFSHADIKSHSLIWQKKSKSLVAVITFSDARDTDSQAPDDTHYFQLPGVTFDEAKGIFTAVAASGEIIPVARIKKSLFLKSIEVMPNANVRIMAPGGDITVILEAISPNDPAMHPKSAKDSNSDSDPDATNKINLKDLLK
jgi:hypothetical protein